jgi:ABC-type multidrug transport system ATPase subunit
MQVADMPLLSKSTSVQMGPAGAGKTSLLDIIAGRKDPRTFSGDLRFCGMKANEYLQRRFVAYVEESDTLLPSLTVRELLLYTAELKRPRDESFHCKEDAVDSLLDRLELLSCRDVRIGSLIWRCVLPLTDPAAAAAAAACLDGPSGRAVSAGCARCECSL